MNTKEEMAVKRYNLTPLRWDKVLEYLCKEGYYFYIQHEGTTHRVPCDGIWFNYVNGDVTLGYWQSEWVEVKVNKTLYNHTPFDKTEFNQQYFTLIPVNRAFYTIPLYEKGLRQYDYIDVGKKGEFYRIDLKQLDKGYTLPTEKELEQAFIHFNATRRDLVRNYLEGSGKEKEALKKWVKRKAKELGYSVFKKDVDYKELVYQDIFLKEYRPKETVIRHSPNYKHLDRIILDSLVWGIRTNTVFEDIERHYPVAKTDERFVKLALGDFTLIFKYYWFKEQVENRKIRRRTYEKA